MFIIKIQSIFCCCLINSMMCTPLSTCKSCGFEGAEKLSYVTDSFMRQSTSMGLENCQKSQEGECDCFFFFSVLFCSTKLLCFYSSYSQQRVVRGEGEARSHFRVNKLVLSHFFGNKIGISWFTKNDIFDTNLHNL